MNRSGTNKWRLVALLFLLGALAATVAACGGNDGDAGASADHDLSAEEQTEFETASDFARCMRQHGLEGLPDPQISPTGYMFVGVPLSPGDFEKWDAAQETCQPVVDDATTPGGTAEAAAWQRIAPGVNCRCWDGSEFSFYVRKANPQKVVFFLEAGGGCFSAETCAPERDLYQTHVESPPGEGIFDFADERNPFADYSVVYVPYCTADVHIGNATREYAPELTVNHNGYVNGNAALDHLVAAFPEATQVVVMGESAGSVASPLYAGLVSDRLPDAKITALADGSGSYPDHHALDEVLAAWGSSNAIPPWPENAGLTAEQWSFPRLFIQSGLHDPEIVFARHDYAYDEKQAFWYPVVGIPLKDLLSLTDANEGQIEAAGVHLLSYVAPGDDHTVLSDGRFYTEEVNGQPFMDWVRKLIEGEPIDDVHCTKCLVG